MDDEKLEKRFALLFDVNNGHVDEAGMEALICEYPQLAQNQYKLAFEGDVPLLYVMCLLRASAGLIKLVLDANPFSIRQLDRNGCSPLHIACQRGALLEVIRILVERFPDALMIRNTYDAIPLFLACRQANYQDVIEYLVTTNECTASDRTKRNETPLHSACSEIRVHSETVRYLIRYDPTALQAADARGRLPLHMLLLEKVSVPLDLIEWIIDLYPDALSRVSDFGMTPLHLACQNRSSFEVVRHLYDRYPEALSAPFAPTPLHIAMMKNCSPNVIEFLTANYKLREFNCVGSQYFPLRASYPETDMAFRQGLKRNKYIRAVTLVDSKLGDAVMANLLGIVNENLNIRSLSLDGITVEVEPKQTGAAIDQALKDLISKNTTLSSLSLRNNSIPIGWMDSLASSTCFLETIDITGCNFGPTLVPILQSILRENSTIHTLLIGGNNIGKNATMGIFDMLRYNRSIRTLEFWRDPIDDDVLESAVHALQECNSTLKKVGLGHWYQSRQCSPRLKSLLEYYCSLNQAGRSVARNPQTTKLEFVSLLSCSAHSAVVLNGLLRDLPHLWSQ